MSSVNLPQVTRAELLAVFKTDKLVRMIEDVLKAVTTTLPGDASAVQSNLDAHIADIADAHQASAIGFTPTGGLSAITVQAALQELDTEKGAGTVTGVSVASANGFAGTVATPGTTPAITVKTTVTGLLKGDGTAVSAATENTDFLPPNRPDATNPMFIGAVYIEQPAPVSKGAAATLTIGELLTGIIQYTGAAAALTLPTGTLIDAGVRVGAGITVDRAFDFCVINTGSGTATITTNTGLTLVGTMTVASGVSAQFRARKTAANAFTVYRIA